MRIAGVIDVKSVEIEAANIVRAELRADHEAPLSSDGGNVSTLRWSSA